MNVHRYWPSLGSSLGTSLGTSLGIWLRTSLGTMLLVGRTERDGIGAEGGGTGELTRGVSSADIAACEHVVLDVPVHRRDGFDELSGGMTGVLQSLGGAKIDAHGRGELTLEVEAHTAGQLVDAVRCPRSSRSAGSRAECWFCPAADGDEVAKSVDIAHRGLNCVPIERLGLAQGRIQTASPA